MREANMEENIKKEEGACCHGHKTKERSEKEYKDLVNRLSRIEGQVEESGKWWRRTATVQIF